ncbi:MAG: serine/threonine-protein kinase [bacterium]
MRLGAYQLEAVLGDGATGVVWRASFGGETVAIKLLRRNLAEEFAQSLSREVHALAALDHPNIVSVIDFDHVRADEATDRIFEGQPYVVFEYGSRGSLDDYLRGGPQISWPWVRSMLMGTLDALAHAHARDFIHRDLKPGNIIGFDRPAGWKLADFGLAFLRGEADQHKVFGTPQFMAPEQFHGQAYLFGPHTDLYALGCMAYLLVCGRLPFAGPNLLALANAHLSAPMPELTPQFVVPEGFSTWVETMLAKNPRDRFELAADAAAALDRLPSVGQRDRVSSEMFEISMETVALSLMGTQISEDQTLDFGEAAVVDPPSVGSRPAAAPQPSTWRKPTTVGLNPLLNASPRLFALRAHDLIGRDVELDRLWTLLVRVRRARQVRSAVITGPEGSGKTHLARWFATRAAETGSSNVFVLGSSPKASILRHARLDHYPAARQADLLATLAEELDVPELIHLDRRCGVSRSAGFGAGRIVLIDNIQNHPIGQHLLEQLLAVNSTLPVPILVVATQGSVANDELRNWMKGADEVVLRNQTFQRWSLSRRA